MKKRFTVLLVSLGLIAAGLISVGQISFVSATTCITETSQYESGDISYIVIKFETVGTCQWTVPTGVGVADALLVAGGGGGGSRIGGGGGGGEVKLIENHPISGSTYTVTVGGGGAGGSINPSDNSGSIGGNGGNSSIFGATAAGGGGGGFLGLTFQSGQAGGSGGGGSCLDARSPGTSTKSGNGLGNSGGEGSNEGGGGCVAGGGGGASGTGLEGASQSGGNGGAGASLTFASTAAITYGGGGGGGLNAGTGAVSTGTPGIGGSGGGGNAGPKNTASGPVDGLPGINGLGGGGGGGSNHYGSFDFETSARGGAGGSGVVIVRYITPPTITNTNGIVMLVDPRSESVPIPYLTVTSGAASRICFDLKSSDDDLLTLKTFSNANTDSDKFRMAVTFGDVTVGNDAKITASRTNTQALLKRNASNSESYLRLYRPASGWSEVDGGKVKVRVDYAVDSDCSGVSGTEINVEIPIKVLEIGAIQKNPVDLSRG